MKKLALFLALIMVVAACVIPVSAADETKTISFAILTEDEKAYLVADASTVRPTNDSDQQYKLLKDEKIVYKFPVEAGINSAKLSVPALGFYEIWAGATIDGAKKVYTSLQSFNDGTAYTHNSPVNNWATGDLPESEYTSGFEPLLAEIDLTSALEGVTDTLYVYIKCTDSNHEDGSGVRTGIWDKAKAIAYSTKYVNRRWNRHNGYTSDSASGARSTSTPVEGVQYSDGMITLTYTYAKTIPAAPAPVEGTVISLAPAPFKAMTVKTGANTIKEIKFDPIDLTNLDNIEFDMFLSDANYFSAGLAGSGQFEIGSKAACDVGERAWMFYDLANYIAGGPVAGWNHVVLPIGTGAQQDGKDLFVPSNFMRIRYFNVSVKEGADYFIEIANIVATESEAGKANRAEMAATEHCVPIYGCNDAAGGFAVDTENKQNGSACLTRSVGAGFIAEFKLPKAYDVSAMKALEFDLYVSDIALFDKFAGAGMDSNIEITSSGTSDKNETSWHLKNIKDHNKGEALKNGWNHIILPITTGNKQGGDTDFSAVNYIRFFMVNEKSDTGITVKIDDIKFTDFEVIPETEPETEPVVTDAPATDAPATAAPATDAPATDAPATDAPATDAPATQPEDKPTPTTFDATASIAIVTVAAMGIVLVSSKKRH